jgi:outer membrane receptor protein involved in Fe transport
MKILNRTLKSVLFAATALGGASLAGAASAQTGPAASDEAKGAADVVVVTAEDTTRSSVVIAGEEMQKLLPGISPLKAIQTLPGVVFQTADPWGNNEQNLSLVIHGFTTQQLGYTLDGVPLGDQQYGNYNGLSVSRAVSSENVGKVKLSSGAGDLGVASTSNLGGAIETFSRDPSQGREIQLNQTLGDYRTTRTFARYDTGAIGDGNTAYISYLHQDQRAWDFQGHQRGDQVNAKFVHDGEHGKLTWYADWQDKVEPNEDATNFGNQQTACSASNPNVCTFTPYTRPFIYPDRAAGLAYLTNGAPPAQYGTNFRNYFSAAQRTDVLTYLQYDAKFSDDLTWSNQIYYHYNYGRGIVAGPVNQAGLPGLFAIYYPDQVVGASASSAGTLANLVRIFGGTGYEVRTTEYRINRGGERSTLNWQLGDHAIEAGLWYEHNESAQHRAWYPFSAANNDLTPYDEPRGPIALIQYYFEFTTDDVQLHLQDQWRITPTLLLQYGVKASLQKASDEVPIQQRNLAAGNVAGLPATNPPTQYPVGSITSNDWFLPQLGLVWDFTDSEQLFANVQKNMRQFIPYGAGSNFYGASPWSLGSQDAFEKFKNEVDPETSWTYELGARTNRSVGWGPISRVTGQVNLYHVDFSNRLFNVAQANFINPNPAVLVNVGGVKTDGVDVAATMELGEHFSFYDAVSYNKSKYDSNYTNGTTVVPTSGKNVPLVPQWLNKFVLSTTWGNFEAQITGDYIGKRYVTTTNDLAVKSTFLNGLEMSYTFDMAATGFVRKLRLSGNITNLFDRKGVSTANVTGPSGGYSAYPIPPRMGFVTVSVGF